MTNVLHATTVVTAPKDVLLETKVLRMLLLFAKLKLQAG